MRAPVRPRAGPIGGAVLTILTLLVTAPIAYAVAGPGGPVWLLLLSPAFWLAIVAWSGRP